MPPIATGWPMAFEICDAMAVRTVSVARIARAQTAAAIATRTMTTAEAARIFLTIRSLRGQPCKELAQVGLTGESVPYRIGRAATPSIGSAKLCTADLPGSEQRPSVGQSRPGNAGQDGDGRQREKKRAPLATRLRRRGVQREDPADAHEDG